MSSAFLQPTAVEGKDLGCRRTKSASSPEREEGFPRSRIKIDTIVSKVATGRPQKSRPEVEPDRPIKRTHRKERGKGGVP